MDKTKDPILKEKESVSTGGLEYSFVSLPQSVIEVVDANVQVVWVMSNHGKAIRPRDIIENAQKMFTSEEIKSQDKFWKEHCAGSLRELVDDHFEANCLRFLKCVPKRSVSDEEKKICETLGEFKNFLNDFAHFKDKTLAEAQNIVNKSTLEEIDEQIFDKICTDFIFHLETFFKYKRR